MKAFKVTYSHGQFIDNDTKKRIIPKQGEEYIITASTDAFLEEDDKIDNKPALNSQEKLKWMSQKYGSQDFGILLNLGAELFFRVGNSKISKGDESREYVFTVSLLEDLYLYRMHDKESDNPESWRMAECKCVLDKCIDGGLSLTEKIPANSLNSLFSHTVMFYFNMQRSGACNAFNTFYLYKPEMRIAASAISPYIYDSLNNLRDRWIQKGNSI